MGYLNSFPLTILAALYLLDNLLNSLHAEATFGMGVLASATTAPGGGTGLATPRLRLETSLGYPWDTVLVIALWAWCGIRLVIQRESKASEDEADRKTVQPSG